MARPVHRLRVPAGLAALIRTLHPHIKRKLRGALEAIAADPDCGKALKDDLAGLRSLRIGRFRLIYRRSAGSRVDLVAFGPRESIYAETWRLIAADPADEGPP